jgi:hypothetical protein
VNGLLCPCAASPTLHNDQRTQASPVQADDEDDDDSGTCSTSSGSGSGPEDVGEIHEDSPFVISVEKRHLVGVPETGPGLQFTLTGF